MATVEESLERIATVLEGKATSKTIPDDVAHLLFQVYRYESDPNGLPYWSEDAQRLLKKYGRYTSV